MFDERGGREAFVGRDVIDLGVLAQKIDGFGINAFCNKNGGFHSLEFNSMAQLGFLGLGIMGAPMARHLLKAGHGVALWSNTASKAQALAKEGAGKACATPEEVANRSE